MNRRSFLFCQSPHWLTMPVGLHSQLPETLSSWLTETGSLTKRLRAIYQQQFAVKVVWQTLQPAFNNECRLLSLPTARYQLIREVVLSNQQQPLILARTIIPEQTLKIAKNKLAHLGNKPLGEVIFAYPDLQLANRQYSLAEISVWSAQLQARVSIDQAIWGRRTVYTIHHQPLLVAEFFLPSLFTV